MLYNDKITQRLVNVPDQPGVYLMRDRAGRVIYVGKAASLKRRVRSYFTPATFRRAEPKLRGLLRSVDDFEYVVLRSEAEAVLTEGRLIKEYKPRYNVLFKDDKRFLLLRVDPAEPFPRFTTCRLRKEDGARYFGPYASSAAARAALDFIEKQYGLRRCRPRRPGPADHRHCLADILRYCSAPCLGRVTGPDYHARVEEACAFLRGERPAVLADLRAAMDEAARGLDFERAAALRDSLRLLREAVKQRARPRASAELRAEAAARGVADLQAHLGLRAPPRVIECYDISNISGTLAVGSRVCALDGLPDRRRYRLFRIRTVEGSDDPAMMREVLTRRFARAGEPGWAPPDLVLVDGGLTQLRAAQTALAELGHGGVPLAGLAKRFEEIYHGPPGGERVLRLPPDAPALHVLQRLRDEAHRFALTYHRRLRLRRIRESALDEIPGVGARRKRQLLERFGSVRRLARATAEEIAAAAPGLGGQTAREILEHLGHGPSRR